MQALENRVIQLGPHTYNAYIGLSCTDAVALQIAAKGYTSALVISDQTVWGLHGEKFLQVLSSLLPCIVITVVPGEPSKSISNIVQLIETAIERGVHQRSCVVGFGGGVPGAIAGMIAALIFRSLPLIHIPTTTVAMFDSVISTRQSANSAHGKNLLGTFYSPEAVFFDLAYLSTLPAKYAQEGLVELIKEAFVSDDVSAVQRLRECIRPNADYSMEEYRAILELALEVKLSINRSDHTERSRGLRLHYGHTLGHALEHVFNGTMSHGEAVARGMAFAAHLANHIGLLSNEDLLAHNALIAMTGLPLTIPKDIETDGLITALRRDGKQGLIEQSVDHCAFVLLRQLGHPAYTNHLPLTTVSFATVRQQLDNLRA